MLNCVSLIGDAVTPADLAGWSLVSDLQCVLGTHPIQNLCIVKDMIEGDDMLFEGVCIDDVCAIVIHECSDSPTDLLMQYQIPPLGLYQTPGEPLALCLTGFCLSGADDCVDATYPECDACEHPCEKLKAMQCCLDDWLCGKRVLRAEWNNRELEYSPANVTCLKERIRELKILCAQSKGCRGPNNRCFRFKC